MYPACVCCATNTSTTDYGEDGTQRLFGWNTYSFDEEIEEEGEPMGEEGAITVKFLFGCNKVYTQSYEENTEIGDVKYFLSKVFNVSATDLVLLFCDLELSDEVVLKDLGIQTFGVLELHLVAANSEDKLSLDSAYLDYPVPDILTVRLQTSDEGIKNIVVEVLDRRIIKPFLGGYYDKETGVEYHHGYTQTGPPKPRFPPELRNHRDTQTYHGRNRKVEMPYSQGTQMTNTEVWIPCVTDTILTPGPYETADEREKRIDIEGKVRTIQRYFRAWIMRKRLKELSAEYHKRLQMMLEREAMEKKEDLDRKKRDIISRVFPRTAADFSMLYAMTERWKKAEIKRIVDMHCGPARIAEFYLLLEKEVEILRSIEAVRQKLKEDRKIQKDIDFFKIIGDPWTFTSSYRNIQIQVDTLETQRGRRYKALYETLCDTTLDPPNQMLALLELKRILVEHNCEVSNEMLVLIDRACEMLARGFTGEEIETLRKRIEGLLFKHFHMTDCNEQVTNRYSKLTEKSWKENLYYCFGCHKLKPLESYDVGVKTTAAKICATCKFIDKARNPWVDISPYRFILRQIRRSERLLHAKSSLAYILQDRDICYIVVHIWHGHSALSECNDIYELRLCRWDKTKDWTPWNCILLTVEEVKSHLRVEELEDVYDENFLSFVFSKHALAKKYFVQTHEIERCVQATYVEDESANQYGDQKCLQFLDQKKKLCPKKKKFRH